jgi:antitoxin (DNA-binding transcriptional repressor) of toxin-antitoxin stability system
VIGVGVEPEGVAHHELDLAPKRLLERAEAGEEIVIGRAGKPVAKLVPYVPERPKRVFGRLKGQIVIHGDFDADNEEIAREFEESVLFPDGQ